MAMHLIYWRTLKYVTLIVILCAHFDEFNYYFSKSNYHIICSFETWLKPKVLDNMVGLHGFTLFRCDRQGKPDGVAVYVSNSFKATVLVQSSEHYY